MTVPSNPKSSINQFIDIVLLLTNQAIVNTYMTHMTEGFGIFERI